MRITLLTQYFTPEPFDVLSLAQHLVRRGHHVQVLTGFPNYPGGAIYPGYRQRLALHESVGGVEVLRVPLFPSHDRSAVRRSLNYLSFALSASTIGVVLSRPTDIVYAFHPPATVAVPSLAFRHFASAPFVYHIQDMWPDMVIQSGMIPAGLRRDLVNRILSAWCNYTYVRASAITVLSPGFRRMLIERGVPPEKVEIIYHSINEDVYFPAPRDARLATALGLSGTFTVMFTGNLGIFQALETAIMAARRLQHLEGFQLVLVGRGVLEDELRALVEREQVMNVRFLGWIPPEKMGAVCNLADVLLVSLKPSPTLSGSIPSKTQVALATGKPVLMAAEGDAADLIARSGAGIVCRPGDELALAATMRWLYEVGPAALASMGARGREFYERHLSLATRTERTERVMEEVVSSHRR